ncbi:hypothetical protein [Robertmurraya massiliosenegalensis]|uniref:hypothetical protein n=1 Tax=Robertmurraya massiliosenegalensis TaxID=1287657 RepID=UPI0002E4C020|nr:hypothetical protein [Robertmurraya massiliosenegalensis]
MKNVMTRAWEIAKEGVKKFGGKVKEYFAQALVMAWAEMKKGADKVKTHFDAVKEAKEFSKKNFDGYVAQMNKKGVKTTYRTSESISMIAPNGLEAIAYVETSNGKKINGTITFESYIFVRLASGKVQRAGTKTIKFNESDYSLI